MNLTTALNSFPGRRGGAACCPRCRPGCSWWAAPPPTSPASRSSRCRTGGSQASEEQSKNRGMFSDRWMVTICNLYSLFISFLEIFECPYTRMQDKQNQNNLCCIIVKEVVYNVLEFDMYVTRVFHCNGFNNRTNCVEMIGRVSGRPSTVSASNDQTMFGQIIGQNSSGFLAAYRCIGFYRYFGQNRDILAKTGIFWPK